jgi:hypothetical protein
MNYGYLFSVELQKMAFDPIGRGFDVARGAGRAISGSLGKAFHEAVSTIKTRDMVGKATPTQMFGGGVVAYGNPSKLDVSSFNSQKAERFPGDYTSPFDAFRDRPSPVYRR